MHNESSPPYQSSPGTEILVDQSGPGHGNLRGYRHVSHGDNRILLVPQPSLNDPNDPLHWPRWKKWLTLFNGCFYTFNGAMTGPMMAGGQCPDTNLINYLIDCRINRLTTLGMMSLSQFFQRPLADITYSNGATLICQGFGTLLWMYMGFPACQHF